MFDSSPPTVGQVSIVGARDVAELRYLAAETPGIIQLQLNGTFYDRHSGLFSLEIYITDSADGLIHGKTNFNHTVLNSPHGSSVLGGQVPIEVFLEKHIKNGNQLIVSVIVINGAGLKSSRSTSVTLDNSPPIFTGTAIMDCSSTSSCDHKDIAFTSNIRLLKACWSQTDFRQNTSGISYLETRLQKWNQGQQKFQDVMSKSCFVAALATTVEFGPDASDSCGSGSFSEAFGDVSILHGQKYRISVRAISASGVPSEHDKGWVYSDGVLIDTTPPLEGRIQHIDPDIEFKEPNARVQASATSIIVSWVPIGMPLEARLHSKTRSLH